MTVSARSRRRSRTCEYCHSVIHESCAASSSTSASKLGRGVQFSPQCKESISVCGMPKIAPSLPANVVLPLPLAPVMRMRIGSCLSCGTLSRIANPYTNARRNDESGLRIHSCVAAARSPLSAHARGFSDKNYFSSSSFFFGLKSTPASLRCCGVIGAGAAVSGS